MKTSFFQKHLKAIQIVAAILVFAVITLIYFSPVLEGKRIKQHDVEMYKGMAQEVIEYRESTGEQPLWTNSMFGGMPAWNISVPIKTNLFYHVQNILTLGLPDPIGSVFISMLGFFILLMVLECGFGASLIGAIAYGFTSYMFIIIGAGHNTKAYAMAYMAPVIAGILLTYKGKFISGSLLTAIALALEIRVNHLQITYYLLLTILILLIAQFISDIKHHEIPRFLKATGILVVAGVLAVLTSTTALYANYEFGKETTRGKPVLTLDENNQTKGLDRDYITQWSYGKGETWSLLIPNAKGGATAYVGNQNPALKDVNPQYRQALAQSNAYWGDQPGTSGPVYVGAVIVFLFLLGALTVKGKAKWALLAATLLSILLSWGKNFMGFTDFFIDYIPGYNKFRAVSMTLVIAELTMPLLGILGLVEVLKHPEDSKKNTRKALIALGITAGFCLLFYLAPKLFFNFLSQGESQQFAALASGKDGSLYQGFINELENLRINIFRKDAIRSFLFIILAFIPLIFAIKGKLKPAVAYTLLGLLIVLDMYPIDKRYLNNDHFVNKHQFDKPFTPSTADTYILNDKALDFRVLNLTKDVFNDASTSYFHKSVGGYHGAKLRRYQDLITNYLSSEVSDFRSNLKNMQTTEGILSIMAQKKVLNMLNTKYIIYNPDANPITNPLAYGNAWTVNNIQWVDTPNDEFFAIANTDVRHTAILHKEFATALQCFTPDENSQATITLTEYKPDQLTYTFNSNKDQLVVFSEIWSDKGWFMHLDGKDHPILRADYLLRCSLIPAGQHEIMMRYEPKIWKVGRIITFTSSALILLGAALAIILSIKKKQK